MAPKSSQAARRANAKAKARAKAATTAPALSWPFDELDAMEEPGAQAVASTMRIFEAFPAGATKEILGEWAAYFHKVGCYTPERCFCAALANMDELTFAPRLDVTPSGEARRTFRTMPDGPCKT